MYKLDSQPHLTLETSLTIPPSLRPAPSSDTKQPTRWDADTRERVPLLERAFDEEPALRHGHSYGYGDVEWVLSDFIRS